MAQTKTPTTQPKPGRTELIAGPLLILLLVGLGLAFIDRRPDRAFITYRYAQNLAAGHGFVYNTGDPHLVSGVSPLYAALLAAIDPADLPLFGSLLGAAGIALGSAALLAMPSDAKGRPVGAGAAAIMLAFPLLWLTLGLETALWIGLCLAGIALYLRGVPWGTALILALATVLHPETLILAGVLVAAAIVEGRPFDVVPVSLYTVGVLAGLIWALNTFDNPLAFLQIDPTDTLAPNAWVGLGAFFAALFDLSLLWLVLPMLAVPGVLHVHAHPWALVVVGWGLLHVAVLAILFVPVYPWSFAPLVPTFAVMAALGVAWIVQRIPAEQPRWIAVVLAVLLIGGAAGESVVTVLTTSAGRGTDWLALAPAPVLARDREVGAWLQENTPPSAVIGLSTADSLGTGALGYFSGRTLLDFRGTLQPELAAAYARQDGGWWIAAEQPDFLVLTPQDAEALFDYSPADDPWFGMLYEEVERIEGEGASPDALIFRRGAPPPPLVDELIGVERFGGLTLLGIATDFALNPLEGERMGRVRLDWLVEGPVEATDTVAIRIEGRGTGQIAALTSDTINFTLWPLGERASTYHTVQITGGLPNGVYTVQIGAGPGPDALDYRDVAQAKIPFPQGEVLGGVSGVRADFGEITLTGYRLARTTEGVEVLLVWQANTAPRDDYEILLQIRDLDGAVIANEVFEPVEGTYPTSVWDGGERVPDTILLDAEGLPPGDYAVYAGLVGPGGDRLLTVSGENAVFVGRLTVSE